MKTALVWFRNDLRTRFNEALEFCVRHNYVVLPVYILNSVVSKGSPEPLSNFRLNFLHEALAELDKAIRSCGANGLVFKSGKPDEIIPALCRKYQIKLVLSANEPGWFEQQQETKLESALSIENIVYRRFFNGEIFNPAELPFPLNELPNIFTSFRKRVEPILNVSEPELPSEKVEFTCHSEAVFAAASAAGGKNTQFTGGEKAAKERLHYYLFDTNLIANYKETRNGLLGNDFSSRLSPWLATGCISAKEILLEIKKYEIEVIANESTYWLVFELLWREYFRLVMRNSGAKLFRMRGLKELSPAVMEVETILNKWKSGQTGEPFIDAAMTELNATGFMSNRARQNAASYLIHDLKQSWIEGAKYFEHLLVDYDVSSNYGNWAYIAGVGNDPRQNRRFNPMKQAEMYDPDRKYVSYWLK